MGKDLGLTIYGILTIAHMPSYSLIVLSYIEYYIEYFSMCCCFINFVAKRDPQSLTMITCLLFLWKIEGLRSCLTVVLRPIRAYFAQLEWWNNVCLSKNVFRNCNYWPQVLSSSSCLSYHYGGVFFLFDGRCSDS